MVYRAFANKFAWAPAVDNLLKAVRGSGIIDYNGFKVETSYDNDLAVKITEGGACEIQGTPVYWSKLEFNADKSYIIDDAYDESGSGRNINTSTSNVGLKQTLEPFGGWVAEIKFYAKKTGTIGADLKVELYNETDSSVVASTTILEADIDTSFAEVVWTLSTPVNLDVDKSYSLRFYRADNTGPTDPTNYDASNYYTIEYSDTAYDFGTAYYYNGSAWTDTSSDIAFYIKRYDYTWISEAQSDISLDSTTVNSTPYSIKWVYTDDGATQYSNRVVRKFGTNKQDWSKRNKIRIAIYPTQALEDVIYVRITNNGTEYDVGTIPASLTVGSWNYVEFDLPTYRDKVENIIFYVDGNNWSTGTYTFYIDDIVVYKKITFTAPASANYGRYDLIYIDDTGEIKVKTGTEVDITTDTPYPQDLNANEIGLALVYLENGMTSIDVTNIEDIRVSLNEG